MVRTLVIVLVALMASGLAIPAGADTIGPGCWEMIVPPPEEGGSGTSIRFFLLFHTDPSSATTATVVGVARLPGGPIIDPPVSGAALLYDPPGRVSMGLTVAPTPGYGPLSVNVQFMLPTLDGDGYCTGGSGACGDGRTITWAPVSCTEPEALGREGQPR